MSNWNTLPKIKLGVYPTPFYRLENISRIYNKDIWIKRDDLCGVALGGNKVRKLAANLAVAEVGVDLEDWPPVLEYTSVSRTIRFTSRF